ncbi:polysaccharide biosynthesis protein [Bifidobacterium hapali]|uniref:Polysaccharide biosynthesis protein n=1 Tax=Bifidobacterium hapali TaxID=1630172 RepID=A0A261G424_9BIFI|nr:polysaccharide biosynthesis protein [Bifidobacterium hapali]
MSGKNKQLKIHSVKYNVVMNMILTSSSFIFPLVTVPYVSRVLSTTGNGLIAFAQSTTNYFGLFAVMGMSAYGIREVAKVRDNRSALSKLVRELLVILLVTSTVSYTAFLIAIVTVPKLRENMVLMLVFGFTIWLTAFGVEWFFQGVEQYDYITIRNIAVKLIGIVLMLLFVHQFSDYLVYGVIVVLSSYGSNIINILRLRNLVDLRSRERLEIRKHIKPLTSFAVSSISSGMYVQIDIVLTGFLMNASMVGLYQLATKIKSLAYAAVSSVGNVMLPRLSYYRGKNSVDEYNKLLSKNFNFMFIAGMAIIGWMVLCGKPIILIIAGSDFVGAQYALACIAPTILFAAGNATLTQCLITQGKERSYALISLLGLVLAFTFNMMLIPLLGIVGAALSNVLCEMVTFIFRAYMVRDTMRQILPSLDYWKTILAFAIAAVVAYATSACVSSMGAVVKFLVFSVVFGGLYAFALIILKERFVQSMLKR